MAFREGMDRSAGRALPEIGQSSLDAEQSIIPGLLMLGIWK
jgi:hypothetical protein